MLVLHSARLVRLASRRLPFVEKRHFVISSYGDRRSGIPYRKFDVHIPDVTEKELVEIGIANHVEHLSPSSFSANPFPVKGRVHGMNQRLIVPLVCRYNRNDEAKPYNVWFLVEPGSPHTFLSVRSLETVIGHGFVGDLHYFDIQVPSSNFECYLSKANFSEVNILGMDIMERLKLSIIVDWETRTFRLIPNLK